MVIQGNFSIDKAGTIIGWACNGNLKIYSSPIWVKATVRDNDYKKILLEETALADEESDDPDSKVFGNGECGFTIDIDWSAFTQATYEVTVTANGNTVLGVKLHNI